MTIPLPFRNRARRRAALGVLLACGLAGSAAALEAQARTAARGGADAPLRVRSEALAQGGYAVVVDLDANRLHFAKGTRVLWSAPVGTGTGLRLASGRGDWEFSTPAGTYRVERKEREPDWIAPDWWFIQNGRSVPPPHHDDRRFPRGLGAAAVYIGQGLAIHGTDRPELLGQRVSAGCIRLSDRDALRLFHNVQVGTEVVIVGGGQRAESPPPPRRGNREGPPPRDPEIVELEGHATPALLDGLARELLVAAVSDRAETRWDRFASVLVQRGIHDGDDRALAGLLRLHGELGPGRLRDEYATYLADAYARGTLRTLSALARVDRTTRREVAAALVEASLALYPGDPAHVGAPWPTRRAPREVLTRDAQAAWDALQAAEEVHRARQIRQPRRAGRG